MELRVPAGVLLCAVAAWLTFAAARRAAPRLLPAAPGDGEGLLRTLLVAAVMTVWPVAVLGFAGWLHAAGILAAAALVYLACLRSPPSPGPEVSRSWPREIRWPAAATLLVAGLDVAAFLPASPVDWDAVTYHLYFPARWLQEGRIFHIPTVFGDNAAAFAPQNGALFFAWQMALTGRDALVNVWQLLCLAILGLALYRICRLLDAGRGPAALAALTLPWLAPVRRWTFSANVDLLMTACAVAALYWTLSYRRQPERSTVAACGLAAGLAAGAKTLGLPLAALAALPLLWSAARRRRFGDLGVFLGCAVAAGGWWYLRGLWRYGNPLFPVKLELGPLALPGAYGAAAIRAGEFHLESAGAVAANVLARYGATTCALAVLGLLALAGRAARARSRRGGAEALILLAFAAAWTAFFAGVVPHNDQARFLLPALAASLAGWGLLLDRVRRWARVPPEGGKWTPGAPAAWLAGVAVAAAASRPWQDWGSSFRILGLAGVDAGRWLATVALCAGAAAGAWLLRGRLGRRVPIAAAGALAWVAVTLGTLHADAARPAYFAGADFRAWAEGYLPFNRPASTPARIALTGANLPYALAGAGWRHRVVYVNTQGEAGDGFYEFWERERRAYLYHKPGLYRGEGDFELWLRRLEEQRIDTVVILRLHRTESRYIRSTPGGFPVEQAWARRRPDRFEPVFTGPAAEIYRLLPAAPDAP